MSDRDPIEYLINAMVHAAQSPDPFKAGYGDKRKAVLEAITKLRAQVEALRAEHELCRSGLIQYAGLAEKAEPAADELTRLRTDVETLTRHTEHLAQVNNENAKQVMFARAENEALRADAERWQFVAAQMTHEHSGPNVGWTLGALYAGDDPESAIDAARAALKEGE